MHFAIKSKWNNRVYLASNTVRVSQKQQARRVFGNRISVKKITPTLLSCITLRLSDVNLCKLLLNRVCAVFLIILPCISNITSRFLSLLSWKRAGEFLSNSKTSLIAVCGLKTVINGNHFVLTSTSPQLVITMRWKIVNNFQRQSPWIDYTPDIARAKSRIE